MIFASVFIAFLLLLVIYLAIKLRRQNVTITQFQKLAADWEIVSSQKKDLALRESEERFRNTFEQAAVGIAHVGLDGRWLRVNEKMCRIIGYSREELLSKTFQEVTYPDDLAADLAYMEQVLGGESTNYSLEKRYIGKDGSIIWTDLTVSLFRDVTDEPKYFISVVEDISDRIAIRKALIESEARLSRAIINAPYPIIIHAEDGTVLQLNQAWMELTGYTLADIPTIDKWTEKAYGQKQETVQTTINQLYDLKKRVNEGEFTIKTARGKTRVWDFSSAPLGTLPDGRRMVISIAKDVSKRKKLEKSLRQTITRLESLHQLDKAILAAQKPAEIAVIAIERIEQLISCQRITIATFNHEAQTATILLTKGGGENTAGVGSQININVFAAIIKQFQEGASYVSGDLSIFSSKIMPSLQAEGLNKFISFPLQVGDETLGILKLWLEQPEKLTSEQIDIASEVSNQVVIALNQARLYQQIHDYTNELEQRVAQRTTQLEEVNQALQAFTYSVSHDLRAPLRSLQGFATAILEDYGKRLDDVGREYALRLVNSSQQLDKLIQDLLAYSRLSDTELRLYRVDLNSVVSEAIAPLNREIQARQAQIIIAESLPEIIGNRTVLVQVVSNLISNGIKFVKAEKKPVIRIWATQHNNSVRLWVADNGIGIDREHQERIFQVFERLHSNETYPGTGIGLAIVRRGMERLGGSSGVESTPGEGSRFWLETLQNNEVI